MMNAMLGAAGSLASGFGGKDVGAPIGQESSQFSFDMPLGDFDSNLFGDFGGAGTFSPFDMNVNAMPDFSFGTFMDSPIIDTPFYGF